MINIAGKVVPKWVIVLIACLIIGTVAASTIFGVIQIGYKITPTPAEAPTFSPETLNLDLGTIPTGSSGEVDFGKVATLYLPVSYEITFTLDLATTDDFTTFDATIIIYEEGETYASYWIYLENNELFNSDSEVMDAGTYDVQVEITYTATSVTTETTGTVKINVSYPG
jgi:hypothetical protein